MPGAGAERGRAGRVAPIALALAVAAGLVGPGRAVHAQGATPAPEGVPPLVDAAGRIGKPWRVVGLPQQTLPLTRYEAQRIDGRDVVRVEAQASYGNLVLDLPRVPAPRRVAWTWRLDRANPRADLHHKAGDDSAAKVCLSFDLPLDQVPFLERQLLRLARSRTGEALPAATLCWVWDPREAPGTIVDNPYSRRVRSLIVRGTGEPEGAWRDESRDVAADFLRAFGDEAREPPPVTALIVAADADNTAGSSLAHVGGLRFEP